MIVTRRTLLKTAGAAALAGGLAGSIMPASLNNAWARSSIGLGTKKIDILSDGNLRLPVNLLLGDVPSDELSQYLKIYNMPTDFLEPACNLTLMRDGPRTILFDAGSGPNFVPSAGKIAEALVAIELDPAQVTHVVFTHAHPDHLWGLLDDFEDPMFSNVQYMISRKEWDYWINPETVNNIGEARQVFAVGAKRNLDAIEDHVTRFEFETEILPGIRAINTIGHTPGHASFEVRSSGQSLVIVGDILTNSHYSFEKPLWPIGADQDQETGIIARKNLLDQLASDNMQMIGFHIPFPGIGRVERAAGAYKFIAH